MARLNVAHLYGVVENDPHITIDKTTHEPIAAMVYIHVVRGPRSDHSGRKYMKHDYPLVITLDRSMVYEIATWKKNDVITMKGTVSSKHVAKPSYCPTCKDENEQAVENMAQGLLVYITPIYARKIQSFETKQEALSHIIEAKEISNEVYVYGVLTRDPKYFRTKNGTIITQYQIALNRKYRIRTDDPEVKTDWPWVKSYGEQAIEDKLRLQQGSHIIMDGVMQARTVHRKTKCKVCGR